MNFIVASLACLILLQFFYFLKLKKNIERSELEKKLQSKDFFNRENNYLSTISTLQDSSKLEQKIINERKEELDKKEKDLLFQLGNLESKLLEETENRRKVVSQKKSSEVRLGFIAETLAPFLDQFEFEPEECTFLGKPVDYISFGEQQITFIEIKSGNAKLNSNQKRIKKQVEDKKVFWKEVRIK
jgi:predicted Holliday junction resolvase-like endonuclease